MEINESLLIFFILAFLIQFLFNHNIISVKIPSASIIPPNKAFEELGGTPILLVKTARPGITAKSPAATERKPDTFFKILKICPNNLFWFNTEWLGIMNYFFILIVHFK